MLGLDLLHLCDGAFDQGGGELLVEVAGLAQAGFELVADRHELVYFGDDAVLLGSWRERNSQTRYVPKI
jgi:hypothetical protein